MILLYGEALLVSHPTPKLEDHTLSSARNCLFNIFAAPLHIRSRSSIRNLRKHHAVVQGADKSLARPGKKQDNVSVRMAWISFGALPCRKKNLDDSSRLDVVEIARPWYASKFVSSLEG